LTTEAPRRTVETPAPLTTEARQLAVETPAPFVTKGPQGETPAPFDATTTRQTDDSTGDR
jgi:hypothetical protein